MALYCFGDSYTEGYKNDMKFWPYNAYRKYLGLDNPKDMPPLWSDLLGEKFAIESFNYGKGGASNHETFFTFVDKCSNIQSGDIVIINWTYIQRCLWITEEERDDFSNILRSVSTHQGEHYDPNGIYKETYDSIAVQRLSFSWTYEILGYQKIIDELAKERGFDVYYWFTDNHLYENLLKIEDINQKKYILNDVVSKYQYKHVDGEFRMACFLFDAIREYGAKTLYEDSEGMCGDSMHLGGTGHRVQAEMFYSYITKTPYPKKLEKYL
jgi:hypothetical protein